jgi:uncharacterized protein with NAD-binding domain and iron-sulfur cluster
MTVVVGVGVAGLTAAVLPAEAGIAVRVIAEPVAGVTSLAVGDPDPPPERQDPAALRPPEAGLEQRSQTPPIRQRLSNFMHLSLLSPDSMKLLGNGPLP